MMANELSMVIFKLDEQQYALHCTEVRQILQAVDIASVPHQAKDQLGIINVEGELINIINIQRRLDLPDNQLSLNDFIVIAHTMNGCIGFVVNDIGFTRVAENEIETDGALDIIKTPHGLIYLLNIDYLMQDNHMDTFNTTQKSVV